MLLAGHLDRVGERYLEGPPDLVVEVSSPTTRRLDLGRKRELYAQFGVPEYWFVDRDAGRVLVHHLRGAEYAPPQGTGPGERVASRVAGGLEVGVDRLLAGS